MKRRRLMKVCLALFRVVDVIISNPRKGPLRHKEVDGSLEMSEIKAVCIYF